MEENLWLAAQLFSFWYWKLGGTVKKSTLYIKDNILHIRIILARQKRHIASPAIHCICMTGGIIHRCGRERDYSFLSFHLFILTLSSLHLFIFSSFHVFIGPESERCLALQLSVVVDTWQMWPWLVKMLKPLGLLCLWQSFLLLLILIASQLNRRIYSPPPERDHYCWLHQEIKILRTETRPSALGMSDTILDLLAQNFQYLNVSYQTANFTHKIKMLISICWECFFSFLIAAFNILNMTRADGWIQNFSKKRCNSPKKTIRLFCTIVTHSVLLWLITSNGLGV